MQKGSQELAIVIPVYKKSFIRETLVSIASQSDTRFNVYIGNDAGPHEIDEIVDDFREQLNITYKRFPDNLGNIDLVAQWERCIELTKDEPFIWLFPDDDIAEENLVKYFYKEIDSDKSFDVYRFNTKYIDEKGQLIKDNPVHPDWESGADFLESRLKGERMSSVGEYIFSRKTYNKYGFRHLPLAWGTDDLAWTEFSTDTGIKTIHDSLESHFLIRLSNENISSSNIDYNQKKIQASLLYLISLRLMKDERIKNIIDDNIIIYDWFLGQLRLIEQLIIIHYLMNESIRMKQAFGKVWFFTMLNLQFDILYKALFYKVYQLYKRFRK